jgi:class 3 adenylate cyclase
MPQERVQRKLAAVLAADVVGYSRLMGADEVGTHVALKACRHVVIDPKVTEHCGRIVKSTGDGILADFASVVDAVVCAVEIQRTMAERNADQPPHTRIDLRIGINLGDVIVDDGDIYGDGVNVAVRVEGIADRGGIAVSGKVYEEVHEKVDISFKYDGEYDVKNITKPVLIYRVLIEQPKPAGSSQYLMNPRYGSPKGRSSPCFLLRIFLAPIPGSDLRQASAMKLSRIWLAIPISLLSLEIQPSLIKENRSTCDESGVSSMPTTFWKEVSRPSASGFV